MPPIKIDFNITQDAMDQAESSGGLQAPVGLYKAVLKSIEAGFSKGDDGKLDKSRPRLECHYQITGEGTNFKKPEAQYSQLYDYVSFSEAASWKLAQFLKAFGVINKPGKGSFDVVRLINKEVLLKVSADKDLQGDYRARVGTLLPFGGKAEAAGTSEEDEAIEDESFDLDEDEQDVSSGEYTKDELEDMSIPELREVVEKFGIDVPKGTKKPGVVALILEAQEEPF